MSTRARGGADAPRLVLEPVKLAEHRRAALDDGRLLGEDLLPRGAQDLRVLQRHVGEHDHGRLHDVRRVQAPAQSGLERHRLCPTLGQGQQRRDREHLELRGLAGRGRQHGHERAHALDATPQQFGGDRHALDQHALVPPEDVR